VVFVAQIISIIAGLMLGLIGFVILRGESSFLLEKLSTFLALFIAGGLTALFLGRRIPLESLKQLPFLNEKLKFLDESALPPLFDVLFIYVCTWVCLGGTFTLFFTSLGRISIGIYPIFFQPLANNIGIIAIFAPSGVGVREGVMIGYMMLAGISSEVAIMLAVMARLWFLISEILIFLIGVGLEKLTN
jgi:uncharacterized membrane protein YbhN (UPF0104 family)